METKTNFIERVFAGGNAVGKVLEAVNEMEIEDILAVFSSAIQIIAKTTEVEPDAIALDILDKVYTMKMMARGSDRFGSTGA